MSLTEIDLDFLQTKGERKKETRAHGRGTLSPTPFAEDREQDFIDLQLLGIRREKVLPQPVDDKSSESKQPVADVFESYAESESLDTLEESPPEQIDADQSKPVEDESKNLPDLQEPALHAEPAEILNSPPSEHDEFESLVVPGAYSFEKTSAPVDKAPVMTTPKVDEAKEAKKWRPSPDVNSVPEQGGFGRLLRNFFASLQGNLVVGLDLGSRCLKYVALSKTRGGYLLEDYDCVEMQRLPQEMAEEEKEKLLAEQVEKFLSGKPLRNCWITSAVSGLNVLFRHHLLPRMPKKDLAEAVPWATRKDLPFPVESALIDYTLLGDRKDGNAEKMEVAAIATPAAVVERHLELLKSNHITPQKISTVTVALWNLLLQKKKQTAQSVIIVDIGALSTHILFVENGRLLFVREITTAGDEFTEALTSTVYTEGHNLTLSPADAEHLKEEYGLPRAEQEGATEAGIPFAQIAVMMRPVVERFVNEIRRSIDYYREKFKAQAIEHIYLTGGGARMQNFAQTLAKEIGIAVEVFDPLQSLGLKKFQSDDKLFGIAPQLAVAVGLAIDRRTELNLLPPALKGAFRLRSAQKYFRYIALFGVIGILCITGFEYFRSQQFANDLKLLQFDYNRLLPRRDEFVNLSQQREDLQNNLSAYQSDILIRLTTPEHLRALSNLIPSTIVLTAINIETMPDNTKEEEGGDEYLDFIVISGIVFPAADGDSRRGVKEGVALADFLIDLEKSGYFRSIDLRDQKQQDDGSIKFTLACFF